MFGVVYQKRGYTTHIKRSLTQGSLVRLYNPHINKLDARTISGYFIGYPEKSKGTKFYYPNYSLRILETGNARFIENGEINGNENPQKWI